VEFKDYYQILGVPKTASDKEIRAAFRKLARQHHPDVNPGDKGAEGRFKEVNEAYEVLSDPEKRKKYDQYGAEWRNVEAWEKAGRPGPRPGTTAGAGPGGVRYEYRTVSPEDLEDLFGEREPYSDFFYDLFGGQRSGPPRPRRGQDLEAPVEVTLEEAFHGATRAVELAGADGQPRRLEVKIPPGVDTGSRVRLAGQGAPGANGGPAGDLYLAVTVRPHALFQREGDDLRAKVEVPFTTLVLGGEAEVRTLTGRVMLKVPSGTPDGRAFRLAGQGMPRSGRAGRGDLHVEVHAAVPTNPSPRERALLEELAGLAAAASQ
jgi:DnaJ-class molecular chaperone